MHTGFWWGNLRKRYHFEYPGVDGRIRKPEEKIPLGIPRRRWEDNTRDSQMKTLNITIKFNGNI